MLDRTRKLDHFFKAAVSDFQLIMRYAFTASSVSARSAQAQHATVDSNVNIARLNPRQIDFDDPPVLGAINISRRTPQPARRATAAAALRMNYAKKTIKRFAGHRCFHSEN